MGNKIKELIIKYKEVILYVFFGGCTTVINIGAFWLLNKLMPDMTLITNAIAWVISVAFAFVTNKLFVFESRGCEHLLKEIGSFTASRLATFALDEGIMYVAVELLSGNDLLWKIIANVIVIILNYVLSKCVVFKKK